MKRIMLCLSALIWLGSSCSEDILDGTDNESADDGGNSDEVSSVELVPKTFTIDIATKTAVDAAGNVIWTMDDDFSVFAVSEAEGNRKFRIESVNGSKAEMKGEIADDNRYCAIYPYNRRNTFSDGKIYSELPGYQAAAPGGTFAEYQSHAVAYTDSDEMVFSQIMALVKVSLPATEQGVSVSGIVLKGNGGEVLAGKYCVDPVSAKIEALPAENVTEVTLNGRFTAGGNYYFAIFPQTLDQGLSLAFKTSDGNEILKSTSDKYVLEAGTTVEITESSFVDLGNNLSAAGTANSYLIKEPGSYYFTMVKGNSSESVGDAVTAEVLWESFGTDEVPSPGDLIREVSVSDDKLLMTTSEIFRNGNAVIAAKDRSGTILWSWHIWFSQDGFNEHTYANGAGVAMDRNLGAYSTEVGNIGSIGLLYQWGRKDPFLGSAGFEAAEPVSTATWPSAVASDATTGTVAYAIANPMTYITGSQETQDWLSGAETDNTRWAEFEGSKTIYDPCPAGWRVPVGNENGLWMRAGIASGPTTLNMDKGYVFPASICGEEDYYPASGSRKATDGMLDGVGGCGRYWTTTPSNADIYYLDFWWGEIYPANLNKRANAYSVRCVKL